ncbi:hypothetical protein DMB90_20095 [Raoultella planticola]|uniref:Uncharacterized protein n=1 Tax=Raoultella planticola TaxID=575 RepID=A0A5P6AAG0_RAOPL|nr:hypothetical protein DMB90_20095 [Raoultella planticola]
MFHEKIRDNGLPAVYRRTAILRALSVLFRLIAGITACRGEISEQSKAILDDDLGREGVGPDIASIVQHRRFPFMR